MRTKEMDLAELLTMPGMREERVRLAQTSERGAMSWRLSRLRGVAVFLWTGMRILHRLALTRRRN